ncbi:GrpB family protein [Peribacillus kribbensis]|uniref:GrpB family protein n=1 Tax=Peribacillus kribbensis TaxID=356658 RepID=UPI0003F71D89|nr:GrpB family protein [Peribacillus kribbensis]
MEPIIIEPHQEHWAEEFRSIGKQLRILLGNTAVRIDHIGSTSIKGLAAKPVIDIQISVKDLAGLNEYLLPLESAGYVFHADNPELTKRFFREPPGTKRTHIHVRQAGSWPEQFALLFRDFMRHSEKDRMEYEKVKYKLAEKYREHREEYVNAKEPFIWSAMKKADDWSQQHGWFPGASDA